ncbi:RNA methyltransferase [Aureisphaera galaxeae]|uniref:TrmH family RNA methyltransferase n=1 Tax=Aureisphaera galaxeae TaxID=1538023 RepID=UPI0023508233|nr:RNA methyltransferase [Aureisphaera galaxeae]MDC8003247.1 RNA methyltransferase [Aureisphaera galaxeae]
MISKNQIKLITGLHQKKYRNKYGLFIAEGPKIIEDLLTAGMQLHSFFATEDASHIATGFEIVTHAELKKISALATANTMLAVFHIPETGSISEEGLTVVLDSVRDPGNLGTIIRLCDWFGVSQVICSPDTVDCFNPKVVQATMGSIARVALHYRELPSFLSTAKLPTYAAVMDGTSVYKETLSQNALLIMGNEANGISSEVEALVTNRITIPYFGNPETAESLNVATATGILLNEFRRATGK